MAMKSVLLIFGSISICFGCNYVVRSTSSDKAAVPLDVCYGNAFFAYTVYRCEDGVPFEYTYSSDDYTCTGDYISRTSAASQTHNCADSENCPYAKVTQYGDCNDNSETETRMIETFVGDRCVEGTMGTCDDTFAEVTRYNDAPSACTGGHDATLKEEYLNGCIESARGNLYEYTVECGLISTSDCNQHKIVFVVLFVLIAVYAI